MDNFDDSIVDIKERAAVVTRTNLLKTTFINAVGNQFTSHHYLLMPAYAYGYILASHRWGKAFFLAYWLTGCQRKIDEY